MFSFFTCSSKIFYNNANNALLEEYMLPLNLCQLVFDQSINQWMYAYTPYETRVQPAISETDKIQQRDDASTTPSFCLRYSKVSLGNGLVSISATCSLEGTYSNLIFCSSTCSGIKWYLIGICLVFECVMKPAQGKIDKIDQRLRI